MSVEVIDKIKPKNGGNFKIVDSVDIEMPDGSSLQEVIKYLTDNVEDITNGKFDPSKYYNMEEIIAKYYDKQEVNDLLSLLEQKLDATQIEDNITNKVNSLFPLGLDLIDHDFDIYLQKENLFNEVKKILDEYNLDINSDIDMEKLNEIFYKKSETMNREEIQALFKSIDKETISLWVSSGHYNKQEVDTLLSSKLNIEAANTIASLVSDLDIHKKESEENMSKLESQLKSQIMEGLSTKANGTALDTLDASFREFTDVTFIEAVTGLCDPDEVRNIIVDEIQNGNLRNEINNVVDDNTVLIQDRIDIVKKDLDKYALITNVNEELNKLKAAMYGLGEGTFNVEFINVINDINRQLEEIQDELDEKEIDRKLAAVITDINLLKTEYTEIMKILSNNNDDIEALKTDTDDINFILSVLTDTTNSNKDSIDSINNSINDTLESFEEVKQELESVKDRISLEGLDELEFQIEKAQEDIDILNAKPYIDDSGVEIYPKDSIYDKIFNSSVMRYDVEVPGGTVSTLFKASDFNSDLRNLTSSINSLNGRISDISTTVENNSFRINVTQGDVYDVNSKISNLTNEIERIEEFGQQISEFSGIINQIEGKVNDLDELTPKSIITKINNTDDTIIINSNALNLRGAIDYYSLSGDLTSLLNKTSSGVFLNGSMITPNTINAKSLNLKGITVKSMIKDGNVTINKYESFGISDSGDISMVNPSIISTDFNTTDTSGYQLLPDGKAIFNNAEVKGKFLLPNAGLYGLTNKDVNEINSVRIWAGSTEENRNEAPFRVQQDGFLFASNASIGGIIAATSLHSGAIHMESDEIKINNTFALLNNSRNNIDEYLTGDEEKEFISLNSRESVINTNVKFSDSLKYDINFKTLDLDGKLNISNDDTKVTFNEKGIKIENPNSKHEIYQNKENGTMVFESGNNSSVTSPDFMFTSRNSVRDCNVKIKGSLEVTEEIKSNKNNVVLRSTENGFAFFSI